MVRSKLTVGLALALLVVAIGCEPPPAHPGGDWNGAIGPIDGARAHDNLFRVLVIDPEVDGERSYAAAEDAWIAAAETAEYAVEVMVENLESTRVAEALIAARDRGVDVRVVGDIDRRSHAGFAALEAAGITPIYGDGEILWNGVFGEDPILRTGEDNRLTHNVILADRLRLVALSVGFPPEGETISQAGFVADSEVIARDFGNEFDQLYGGTFSTRLTFYDQPVKSDNNDRTLYPTEGGAIELYFGPQEPLAKEIIDRIYSARSAVWIATGELRNSEVARALRYKASVGFDVRVVIGSRPELREEAAELEEVLLRIAEQRDRNPPQFRVNPSVAGTLIILDGQPTFEGDDVQPGAALVWTAPLFESVAYYVRAVRTDSLDLAAQPSDRFTDGHLWGVHAGGDGDNPDYLALRAQFERIFEAGESGVLPPEEE